MRHIFLIFLIFLSVHAEKISLKQMQHEKRLAFVVGNEEYDDSPIPSAVSEAKEMSAFLQQYGFEVVYKQNATKRDFISGLRSFVSKIEKNSIVLFYFIGHSVQVKKKNYLIPIDSSIDDEYHVPYEAIKLDAVLKKIKDAPKRLGIVIIDASYKDPFGDIFIPKKRGLAKFKIGKNIDLVLSAKIDKTANSYGFTKKLLSILSYKGVSNKDGFTKFEENNPQSLLHISNKEFYFNLPDTLQSKDDLLWNKAVSADSLEIFNEYIKKFPKGKHIRKAKETLSALEANIEKERLAKLKALKEKQMLEQKKLLEEKIARDKERFFRKLKLKKEAEAKLKRERELKEMEAEIKAKERQKAREEARKEEAERLLLEEKQKKAMELEAKREKEKARKRTEKLAKEAKLKAEILRKTKEAELKKLDEQKRIKRAYTNYIEPKMVFIKPGEFYMGSDDESSVEKPRHLVKIKKGFCIGKYEVTNKEYKMFLQDTHKKTLILMNWRMDSQPAVGVTWFDAVEYATWLSELTGKKYRLPTEQEWEYAARAGLNRKFLWRKSTSTFVNNEDKYAWLRSNSDNIIHRVGRKRPNAWGLYDVLGNVAEWCQDTYSSDYNTPPNEKHLKIVRGGSWFSPLAESTLSHRGVSMDDFASYTVGFRLVRDKK